MCKWQHEEREKKRRLRKTSKAREEVKDVVGRENSSQERAPSLFGSFTASSRAGRIAHHILAAGKTQTVSTLGREKKKTTKNAQTLYSHWRGREAA